MELGEKIKTMYEIPCRSYLPAGMGGYVIRLDGVNFHNYTKEMKKPFDDLFMNAMMTTTYNLCQKIPNIHYAYSASDEISLYFYNDGTEPMWQKGRIDKICSISASWATYYFNEAMRETCEKLVKWGKAYNTFIDVQDYNSYLGIYLQPVVFDSRCYCLGPHSEEDRVWRQNDCTKNSILSLAYNYYSHVDLLGLNTNQIQNKLYTEKNVNWNNLEPYYKRGFCVEKWQDGTFKLDKNMPILKDSYALLI